MTLFAPTQAMKRQISELLNDLPPESLVTVEQFVRFLRYQRQYRPSATPERPRFRYPTVPVPVSSLDAWTNLLPGGYEGDALADTEALYDEV